MDPGLFVDRESLRFGYTTALACPPVLDGGAVEISEGLRLLVVLCCSPPKVKDLHPARSVASVSKGVDQSFEGKPSGPKKSVPRKLSSDQQRE